MVTDESTVTGEPLNVTSACQQWRSPAPNGSEHVDQRDTWQQTSTLVESVTHTRHPHEQRTLRCRMMPVTPIPY